MVSTTKSTLHPPFEPFVLRPEDRQAGDPALVEEILQLKADRDAVILAHNYQIESIQAIADYVGDSLGLAFKAAEAKSQRIVFCGVHFMAETAKIVNPTRKVLLPDLDAGCSLSDSCPPERLRQYREENPDIYVVAYINCSAGVKALSDVICTSGNATRIVERVPEDREILFVPDQNLGRWVSQKTGRQMRYWPGSCYVHVLFTENSLNLVRARFPQAPVVAHPECTEVIRNLADHVCSTEGMIGFAQNHPSDEIIVATETSMLHRLQREVPDKTFIAAPAEQVACRDYRTGSSDRGACNYCRYMKMNTLEKLRNCLRDDRPEILLPAEIQEKARLPLQRMLEWSA
ncbi:MAG: quinolinate synthase NadA [Puniceicoccaceae bacterium]